MDERLKEIFSNINDWLKYAEAKSATLIAGNGALIFGFSRLANSYDIKGFCAAYLLLSVFLCIISMVVCLMSIVPSLSMPWGAKLQGKSDTDNIFYFSDIAKYTPLAFLKALESKMGLKNTEVTGYQKDLANQIIINSVIAHRKYKYFQAAIWLTLSALISPLVALLIYGIREKQ